MRSLFTKCLILISIAAWLISCNNNSDKNFNNDSNISSQPYDTSKEYEDTELEPVFDKLNQGQTLSNAEIEKYSGDIATRADFYQLLSKFGKEQLFPKQYYNFEKASEAAMVSWLVYPTELDTVPSQIELLKIVDYKEHDSIFKYYVFKFKTSKPHWSEKNGWMVGVVGPYFPNSKPYDWTNGTFSKLTKIGETTPEKEVEWIHKNIFRKTPN